MIVRTTMTAKTTTTITAPLRQAHLMFLECPNLTIGYCNLMSSAVEKIQDPPSKIGKKKRFVCSGVGMVGWGLVVVDDLACGVRAKARLRSSRACTCALVDPLHVFSLPTNWLLTSDLSGRYLTLPCSIMAKLLRGLIRKMHGWVWCQSEHLLYLILRVAHNNAWTPATRLEGLVL